MKRKYTRADFQMSRSDRDRLKGVKPVMIRLAERIYRLFPQQFDRRILRLRIDPRGGKRTRAVQRLLFETGASKTMDSAHLKGEAIDFVIQIKINGRWEPIWEKQLYVQLYHEVIAPAAEDMGIGIGWGGDWDGDLAGSDGTFFDGPHVELKRAA